VFQRLREWYLDGQHKSGKTRREIEVSACFAPLLRFLVRLWNDPQKHLPLVADATTLGNRWTVLAVSVVIKGGAIPVAWKVLRAEAEGSWRPYWEQLFANLAPAIPSDWLVIVLADRGLYARWMWDAIRACGWHPFLRINLEVKASLADQNTFVWLNTFAPRVGTHFKGVVDCFASKASRLRATLLMHWEAGYESAWAMVTDLDPAQAEVSWYRMRSWIEGGGPRLQTGDVGMATQQNDPRKRGGAALAGHGTGSGLVLECGGRSGTAAPGASAVRGAFARNPCGPAQAAPPSERTGSSSFELCAPRPLALAGADLAGAASGCGTPDPRTLARDDCAPTETRAPGLAPRHQDPQRQGAPTSAKTARLSTLQGSVLRFIQKTYTCKGQRSPTPGPEPCKS